MSTTSPLCICATSLSYPQRKHSQTRDSVRDKDARLQLRREEREGKSVRRGVELRPPAPATRGDLKMRDMLGVNERT